MELVVIFNSGEYSFGQFKRGRIVPISDSQIIGMSGNLPKIRKDNVRKDDVAEYSDIVKSVLTEIDNIEFIEEDEFFQIYDKTCFESIPLELPIFVKFLNNYKSTGKFYQYTFYSLETIKAANKLADTAEYLIAKKIDQLAREKNIQKFKPIFEEFEKKLDENGGLACIELNEDNIDAFHLFLSVKSYPHFQLTLFDGPLFIVSKKDSYGSIELKIPKKYEEYIPHFIGRGGKQAKKIADYFNAKYIKFILES